MVVKTYKDYIADELLNKVHNLTKALNNAEKIIKVLEKENLNLKDALNNLAPVNKEDYSHDYGNISETKYATQA